MSASRGGSAGGARNLFSGHAGESTTGGYNDDGAAGNHDHLGVHHGGDGRSDVNFQQRIQQE